jgi:hypothetical protein
MNVAAGARSEAGAPNATNARHDWVAAMRGGDFDAAWAISDRDLAALCRSGPGKHEGPRHEQRIWRGEDLQGRRVLVRCYHGLGDTIQFIRFAEPLRRIAREVIVWCQPELVPLVARVSGVDRVLPLHQGTPDVGFDVDVEIMEIAHAIRAQRDQIAMRKPYLAVPSASACRLPRRDGDLAVGLVWEAGDWDRRRSFPPLRLRQLRARGVQLYSLQRGEAAKAAPIIGAIDLAVADIESLACRLCALDLLICPDTMVAHLSAALGRETWIVLHSDCDWRWPGSGSSTFWYSSARLFHQRGAGDWGEVIEEVRRALQARAEERCSPAHPCQAGRVVSSGTGAFGG